MQKSPGKSMVGDFDGRFFLLLQLDHNVSAQLAYLLSMQALESQPPAIEFQSSPKSEFNQGQSLAKD
jgi:hypothetical protein